MILGKNEDQPHILPASQVLPSTTALFRAIIFGFLSPALLTAEDWPAWRGPRGDGSCREMSVPETWNGQTGENILWKIPVPGIGHGSPIVSDGKIFLATCIEESKTRMVVCVDAKTGTKLWAKSVFTSPLEVKHKLNSFASSTPAADNGILFIAFLEIDGTEVPAKNVGNQRNMTPGKIVVAAYDFDGTKLWDARPGIFASVHGFCSNPVVYGDLVIINGDHDGESYIVALDRKSGSTIWKTPRSHETRSYATPLVRNVNGKDQLVLPGSKAVTSFDPRNGKTIWVVDGPTEQFVASPVYNGKHFFVAAGFPTHHVVAIRPTGKNNVTDTHVTWHQTEVRSYVPSPLLVGEFLMVADDRGTANCYDVATGKRYWNVRLGRKFSASPIQVEGKAYFLAENGTMHIVRAGKSYELVAENPLGERSFASPAVADQRIYIRSEKSLFAIGE